MCGRVIPAEILRTVANEARARSAALAAANMPGVTDAVNIELDTDTPNQLMPLAASTLAPLRPLQTKLTATEVLRRYSAFTDGVFGAKVLEVLRVRFDILEHDPAAVDPAVYAAGTARQLCTAILRWTGQAIQVSQDDFHRMRNDAGATSEERQTVQLLSRSIIDDPDDEAADPLTLSEEMLRLALAEWPTTQEIVEARPKLMLSAVPVPKAIAAARYNDVVRRLTATKPPRAIQDAASFSQYLTLMGNGGPLWREPETTQQ